MTKIYESILDDMTADSRSKSDELRRATQHMTAVPGEGQPYDYFSVRVRIRLTDNPPVSGRQYDFPTVISNVQTVLDSNRFITDYSEIFISTAVGDWKKNPADDRWLETDSLVRQDDFLQARSFFGEYSMMTSGLFLNFSFNYSEFRNPLDIGWLLVRLHEAVWKDRFEAFRMSLRYIGMWFKYSSFGEYNIYSVHDDGLVKFMRNAGQIQFHSERTHSGYCQINKAFHLFFEGDSSSDIYRKIFNKCRFDITAMMFNMVKYSVFVKTDLIETLLTQEEEKYICTELDFSKFLKSFGKNHQMNENFFFFMWPVPDQNLTVDSLKTMRMPLYKTPDVQMDDRLAADRDRIVKYLSENKISAIDVQITEDRGKFAVALRLETIFQEDEVPIDVCACFAFENFYNDFPGARATKKEVCGKWADFMCDDYLLMIMPEDGANIIRNKLLECFKYYN